MSIFSKRKAMRKLYSNVPVYISAEPLNKLLLPRDIIFYSIRKIAGAQIMMIMGI